MQFKPALLLVAFCLLFVTLSHSQPKNYVIQNIFSVGGGLSSFDISTDNFITKSSNGWFVSAGIGAPLPNKWYDISYNIQLAENKVELSGRVSDDVNGDESLEYKIFTTQVGIVFHVNIIGSTFTLDLGPQLQYNGEMELTDRDMESYFINGFEQLMAADIEDINNFNLNAMGGVTLSFGNF